MDTLALIRRLDGHNELREQLSLKPLPGPPPIWQRNPPQRERVSSVTWEDLQCGEAINVYGRHLLLMACDSSTKEWYARRGIKQRTLTVSHGEVEVRSKAEAR